MFFKILTAYTFSKPNYRRLIEYKKQQKENAFISFQFVFTKHIQSTANCRNSVTFSLVILSYISKQISNLDNQTEFNNKQQTKNKELLLNIQRKKRRRKKKQKEKKRKADVKKNKNFHFKRRKWF